MVKKTHADLSTTKNYLVIADGSKAMENALQFCMERVQLTKFGLILLHVVNDSEFVHWLGVGAKLQSEAKINGESLLHEICKKYENEFSCVIPLYREGNLAHITKEILQTRTDIASFVIGVDDAHRESGDIIQYLYETRFRQIKTPIIIVPC